MMKERKDSIIYHSSLDIKISQKYECNNVMNMVAVFRIMPLELFKFLAHYCFFKKRFFKNIKTRHCFLTS